VADGADDKAEGAERTDLRRILPHLRPDLRFYALALAAAPVSTGLAVLQPWLLKQAIDQGISARSLDALQLYALAYLGAGVCAFLAEAAYTVLLSIGASRSITRLRGVLYEHILSLGASFHAREPTGRLLTRVTSDIEALGETLTAGAVTIVLDVLTVLSVMGAMLWLDMRLTAVLLLVVPPLALAVELLRRQLRSLFVAARATWSELVAFAAERIHGVEIVQLYRDEQRSLQQFDTRLAPYRQAQTAANVWDALMFALVDGLSSVTMGLMLWYGTSSWLDSPVTAGLLAAFVDYVSRLFTPIRELSNKVAILQRAAASVDKISQLLGVEERVGQGSRPLPAVLGSVELEGVHFGYAPGHDVLHGISLVIQPGEVVALVGRTGSGKTTVGKLLIRAYDGYRGHIRIDGVELAEVELEALRRRVTVVQQDVVLFPGDVRFNLTLGDPIPDERLHEALALAQCSDVVARLGGLDGRVEAGGRNLSVGECQLLSFARVLARDAPLVILDEATASVDSATEAKIQEATAVLLQQRTVLVVAHRLSTVVGADRIVVMDAGRVLESGSHAELMARGGAYASLFHSQYAGPRSHSA
jgi:ATP-binding cassette subfamily B multidrug efflux pump